MASPTVAVIPARYASRRFPGKPLALIDGVPMIVRVARQVAASDEVDRVVVASDDARILEVARADGHEAVSTSGDCASGSDRVAEAIRRLAPPPALVVNVQGDEPLLDPRDLDALLRDAPRYAEGVGTLARPLSDPDRLRGASTVKVVTDARGRALYFSRAPIPHGAASVTQHVGVYAYPPSVLERFTRLPPSRLEQVERLEQLRALENGISIHVTMCVSERPSIGVDVPEDVEAVERELHLRRRSASGSAA